MHVGLCMHMHVHNHAHTIDQHTQTQETTQREELNNTLFTQYQTIPQPPPHPYIDQQYRSV